MRVVRITNVPKSHPEKVALRLRGIPALCLECAHHFIDEDNKRICAWVRTSRTSTNEKALERCRGFLQYKPGEECETDFKYVGYPEND
jgi:hypothetical protein